MDKKGIYLYVMIHIDNELIAGLLAKYFFHLKSQHPLLGKVRHKKILHDGGMHYQSDKSALDMPLYRTKTSIFIPNEDVFNYNISNYAAILYKFVEEKLASMMKTTIKTLHEITAFTGNVVKGFNSAPAESYIKMLETVEIQFTPEGKPVLPTIMGDKDILANLSKIQFTEEQEKRVNEIIEEKKKKHYAQKCNRRLSYFD